MRKRIITSILLCLVLITNTFNLKNYAVPSATTGPSATINPDATINLVQNPGFEDNSATMVTPPKNNFLDPSGVAPWETTDSLNQIEVWQSGFTPGIPGGVTFTAHSGDWFAEINANSVATLYQQVAAVPGGLYKWGVWHMGRNGDDTMHIYINGVAMYPYVDGKQSDNLDLTDGQAVWGNHMGYYMLPITSDQTSMDFQMQAISTANGINAQGNFVDDASLYLIVEPTIQYLHVGDPTPADDTLAIFATGNPDGYTCSYADPNQFGDTVDKAGTNNVLVDIYDKDGNLIGTVTSTIVASADLNVQYVDENGNNLQTFDTVTYYQENSTPDPTETLETYDVTPTGDITIDGLTYVYDKIQAGSDPVTGTMDTDKNVVAVLKLKEYATTEKYQTEDGTPLLPDKTGTIKSGDTLTGTTETVPKYQPIGYKVNGGSLIVTPSTPSIPNVQEDTTIIYIYIPITYKITENYQDTAGTSLADEKDTTANAGDKFDGTVQDIPNYTLKEYTLNGVKQTGTTAPSIADVEGNYDIVYIYEKNQYTITEQFQTMAGTTLSPDVNTTKDVGDDFTGTPKTLPKYQQIGYKIDNGTIVLDTAPTITNIQDNTTITYIYTPINYKITENYQDTTGTSLADEKDTRANAGDGFTGTVQDIANYTIKGYKLDGGDMTEGIPSIADVEGDHDIVYIYDKIQYTVTEQYQDTAGNTLLPNVDTTKNVGDGFTGTVKDITSYTYQGYTINGGVMQSGTPSIQNIQGSQNIVYIYKKTPTPAPTVVEETPDYTVVEHYQTPDGAILIPSVNTTKQPGDNFSGNVETIPGYHITGYSIDGGPIQTGMPSLSDINNNHNIVYTYEKDPDPVITYVVTENYQTPDGTILVPSKDTTKNAGDNFDGVPSTIPGYTYQGYTIDGGAIQPGNPSIEDIQSDKKINYIYQEVVNPTPIPKTGESDIYKYYILIGGIALTIFAIGYEIIFKKGNRNENYN
ncbi:MAG: MucBP domain-containing protein [Oscillospiraceae bacterium]|nr:MucBP domain-containing protein [Oscillospiraceae bacterium]